MTVKSFLDDLMRRRKRLPSQLAADLGVSHATVRRWLLGEDVPSPRSCRRIAEYADTPLEKVLAIMGHLTETNPGEAASWPEFRDYMKKKYPGELDDDLITMVEDLIERKRQQKVSGLGRGDRKSG